VNQLRTRVLAILVAAALPAILFISVLAYWIYQTGKDAALVGLSHDVALLTSRFDAIPPAGMRLAWLLASTADWGDLRKGPCDARVKAIVERFPGYGGMLIYEDGALVCSAGAPFPASSARSLKTLAPALGASQTWAGLLPGAAGGPVIAAAGSAANQGRSMTVVLAIDPRQIATLLGWFRSVDSSRAQLVDRNGQSIGAIARNDVVPIETPLPDGEQVRTVGDASGRSFIITSTKLASADVWVVTEQRETDVLAGARNQMILALMAPVLTLLLVGLAVWFGLTQFVIRWINRLILVTRAYSEGDLGARVGDAGAAPREIRELARRFDGLADRMAERSVELEGEVLQKRRYIRELHHRVKNNLQVIASLLALQKRSLPPPQRVILRFPVDRVNAMAAAFGVSYSQTESGDVGVLAVVREVISRLETGAESRKSRVELSVRGEEREVNLDTAIAIAMLLAELLPPFLAAGAQSNLSIAVDVELLQESLIIRASSPSAITEFHDRLSRRFISAYLSQLHASLSETTERNAELSIPLTIAASPNSAA